MSASADQSTSKVTTPPGAPDSEALLPAIPGGGEISFQLEALCQNALTGQRPDVERLAKWAALAEQEALLLRRRLRKQQHDFATLFEIVGQTSARALDVVAMQTYLLRTVSGHFATPRLMIMRRVRPEDHDLTLSAAQGVRQTRCQLPLDGPLCQYALEKRLCFRLTTVASALPASSHDDTAALEQLGVHLIVPLIQEVEGPGAVLEGLLLLGPRLASTDYNDEDIEFLEVLGKMLAICLRNEALYRRSIIDDLTGVASRGHFEAQLSQELNRIATYGHRSMCLVLLDVDDFKKFNDTYGHQTGDRVLQELSRTLSHQVRNVDLVARYGGEEFAIILLEIDRVRIAEVAERLRSAVEDMEVVSLSGEKLHITCSFGLACFPDDATDKSTLIQLADEALYKSKAAGRNRVTACLPGAGIKEGATLPKRRGTDIKIPPSPASQSGTRPKVTLWPATTSSEMQEVQKQQQELTAEIKPTARDSERRRTPWPRKPDSK